jgi:hypothetical protein
VNTTCLSFQTSRAISPKRTVSDSWLGSGTFGYRRCLSDETDQGFANGGILMAENGGKTAGSGSKSGGKSASASSATKSSSGKQGGSHDQHTKAGEQSHKSSK